MKGWVFYSFIIELIRVVVKSVFLFLILNWWIEFLLYECLYLTPCLHDISHWRRFVSLELKCLDTIGVYVHPAHLSVYCGVWLYWRSLYVSLWSERVNLVTFLGRMLLVITLMNAWLLVRWKHYLLLLLLLLLRKLRNKMLILSLYYCRLNYGLLVLLLL